MRVWGDVLLQAIAMHAWYVTSPIVVCDRRQPSSFVAAETSVVTPQATQNRDAVWLNGHDYRHLLCNFRFFFSIVPPRVPPCQYPPLSSSTILPFIDNFFSVFERFSDTDVEPAILEKHLCHFLVCFIVFLPLCYRFFLFSFELHQIVHFLIASTICLSFFCSSYTNLWILNHHSAIFLVQFLCLNFTKTLANILLTPVMATL